MRILIHSPAFLPLVGGLEINTATLAAALAARGHEIVVWTTTSSDRDEPVTCYQTVRRPGFRQALRLVAWSEVVLHQNLSLRGVWPLLLVRRPWVVSHHSWYCRPDGALAWQDRIKRWALRRADASIAVSRAMADDLGPGTTVIENPYRDHIFRRLPSVPRDQELAFVGRLVSDKGVDVLLRALSTFGPRAPRLTVVGDGPERTNLVRLATELALQDRVVFLGTVTDSALAELLNRHQTLVVPSRYNEPFGIVALEGIACGCTVIGTAGGGLPDSIGPCGIVVENGNAEALARAIDSTTGDHTLRERLMSAAPTHLWKHTRAHVALMYESALEQARARNSHA